MRRVWHCKLIGSCLRMITIWSVHFSSPFGTSFRACDMQLASSSKLRRLGEESTWVGGRNQGWKHVTPNSWNSVWDQLEV